ncbi:hypothetical protein ACLQ2X_22535 [Micromonospora sp. DT31]
MPVSALDQHLKGICRPSAHPDPAAPDRVVPGRAAPPRHPAGVLSTRIGEAR